MSPCPLAPAPSLALRPCSEVDPGIVKALLKEGEAAEFSQWLRTVALQVATGPYDMLAQEHSRMDMERYLLVSKARRTGPVASGLGHREGVSVLRHAVLQQGPDSLQVLVLASEHEGMQGSMCFQLSNMPAAHGIHDACFLQLRHHPDLGPSFESAPLPWKEAGPRGIGSEDEFLEAMRSGLNRQVWQHCAQV